jgi:hypothetical protein
MPRLHQPIHHCLPLLPQVSDCGRHIDLDHHPSPGPPHAVT